MFNFLICAGDYTYTNYFNFESLRGISLCLGLILLGCALIACTAVFFADRKHFGLSVFVCFAILLTYAIAVAIANIAVDFKEGETYTEKYQIIIIAVLAILIISLIILFMTVDFKQHKGRKHTLSLVYAAICIALSFGLSYIRLFKAPFGGSITVFSLVPLAVYSYMFGIRKGVLAGFIYGILQSVQDPWVVHPLQYILDYLLPFSLIGLCGGAFKPLFRGIAHFNSKFDDAVAISLGLLAGVLCRFGCHLISGAVYFGEYAAGYGFDNVWTYSFVYQCTYVLPDGAIAILGAFLLMLSPSFRRQMDSVVSRYNKVSPAVASESDVAADNDPAPANNFPCDADNTDVKDDRPQ